MALATDRLADELIATIAAIRTASDVCRGAQGRLLAGHTLTKGDASPVTIADFAAQAVVCAELTDRLGDIAMIGEEDSNDLQTQPRLTCSTRSPASCGRGKETEYRPSNVLDWISWAASVGGGRKHVHGRVRSLLDARPQ